jgi:hypothetical protein
MERAAAAVFLACAELTPVERLVVLQAAIKEALAAHESEQWRKR